MKINMHIEQLIVEDLVIPRHQQACLQVAVETELARLLTADFQAGSQFNNGNVSSISAGDIHVEDGNDPGFLGQQIARAVYAGVNR